MAGEKKSKQSTRYYNITGAYTAKKTVIKKKSVKKKKKTPIVAVVAVVVCCSRRRRHTYPTAVAAGFTGVFHGRQT